MARDSIEYFTPELKEWLINRGFYDAAIRNVEKHPFEHPGKPEPPFKCLADAFMWAETEERFSYWGNIAVEYKEF